ncbi:MAG: iron-containing alcohol dehydrogenase, partial [Clostridiaceae bacterium]|nr:iron-containing alcohol dehydrogenase [Clostridiaceae bacterium]
MLNFDFYNPTRIIFGKDRLGTLDTLVPSDAAVLILTFRTRIGLIDNVKDILGTRKVLEFVGIEPNPRFETALKAMEIVKNEKIDFLLAIGGGSVIDATKFISLAANYNGDPLELMQFDGAPFPEDVREKIGKVIPLGVVLTLPATGSEMNCNSAIVHTNGKHVIIDELLFPKFTILDPTLSFTLPEVQIVNGIADTFVHVTEQYITYPVDARVSDRISEGILQTIIEIGETTIVEPENYNARA